MESQNQSQKGLIKRTSSAALLKVDHIDNTLKATDLRKEGVSNWDKSKSLNKGKPSFNRSYVGLSDEQEDEEFDNSNNTSTVVPNYKEALQKGTKVAPPYLTTSFQ